MSTFCLRKRNIRFCPAKQTQDTIVKNASGQLELDLRVKSEVLLIEVSSTTAPTIITTRMKNCLPPYFSVRGFLDVLGVFAAMPSDRVLLAHADLLFM